MPAGQLTESGFEMLAAQVGPRDVDVDQFAIGELPHQGHRQFVVGPDDDRQIGVTGRWRIDDLGQIGIGECPSRRAAGR